ncbi:N-acyl homoserine lactonase family protein [Nocardia carnea]|uniref:N-acyl homoserine lactonase family protein n=2 Tax=Nocardia carnea TaxID=37328 RepID=UPI002457D900|nr:N-acyl homoserine lactonase family protein [Nocardia carnea]
MTVMWELYALRVGESLAPCEMLSHGAGAEFRVAPIVVWVLRRGGTIILFDTGGPAAEEVARSRPGLVYRRTNEEHPILALAALDVKPDDVSLVVCSHLHWDHSSNNDLFERSRLLVQDSEWRAAQQPPAGHAGAYGSPDDESPPGWWRARSSTDRVSGDVELLPGVELLHLPGHTPGSQGLVVETTQGAVCLAGDLVPLAANMLSTPPTLPGITSSREAAVASLRAVGRRRAKVMGSHDDSIFTGGATVAKIA